MRKADDLHVIEAVYDVESDETTWLSRLAHIAQHAFDGGRGVIANMYDVSTRGGIRITAAASGVQAGFFEFFQETSRQLDEDYIERSYLSATACALTSEFGGWHDLPFVRSGELARWGVTDDLILRGWEPGGRGVTLNLFQPTSVRLTGRRRAHLSRIASHLGTAYRLRRRLHDRSAGAPVDAAEAILDTAGVVHHAVGVAKQASARARLRQAVADIEHARGALRSDAPEQAVQRWHPLVDARWSLVDEFQNDSRRYVVAYVNDPLVPGPEVLTARERQVAVFAAAGHWTKLIAYRLGISDSTVRVLLARARSKLGARSRSELARIVGSWPTDAGTGDR